MSEKPEIDHLIPCSSFDHFNDEDIKKCHNWRNLQLMDKSVNLHKGSKEPHPVECIIQELLANVFEVVNDLTPVAGVTPFYIMNRKTKCNKCCEKRDATYFTGAISTCNLCLTNRIECHSCGRKIFEKDLLVHDMVFHSNSYF